VQFDREASQTRDCCVAKVPRRARDFGCGLAPSTALRVTPAKRLNVARLAQISFDFAQDRLSRRKRDWLGMTMKLLHSQGSRRT